MVVSERMPANALFVQVAFCATGRPKFSLVVILFSNSSFAHIILKTKIDALEKILKFWHHFSRKFMLTMAINE